MYQLPQKLIVGPDFLDQLADIAGSSIIFLGYIGYFGFADHDFIDDFDLVVKVEGLPPLEFALPPWTPNVIRFGSTWLYGSVHPPGELVNCTLICFNIIVEKGIPCLLGLL